MSSRLGIVGLIVGVALCVAPAAQAQCIDDGKVPGHCSTTTATECFSDADCPGIETCVFGEFTVRGGQINMSGATLFVDFFRAPSSTNDWNDVDGDGYAGWQPAVNPDVIDQLAEPFIDGLPLDTFWAFNYRSVGSVNGYNEFVANQVCGAIPLEATSEAGLFNGFEYSGEGVVYAGGANRSGTPLEQCEIGGAFLDVPGLWGTKVDGTPNWDDHPGEDGYGLCPVPSSIDTLSQLKGLDRDCGLCTVTGEPCVKDQNCPQWYDLVCSISGDPCDTADDCPDPVNETCDPVEFCDLTDPGAIDGTLNANTAAPDDGTVYSYVGAWVPVSIIANRGTGHENFSYSDLQYHFLTGRLKTGENLAATTRDVGSGTRNAAMNSLGIDTSWGRGENMGKKNKDTNLTKLGPDHQSSNCGGSSVLEGVIQNRRLAMGYTGLAGGSRSAKDAIGGKYEIMGVWNDEDCAVADSYVRPSVETVVNNCDPCTGYQIAGSGSFVVKGDINANRDPVDPKYVPEVNGNAVDNQQVAEYLNNIFDSTEAFAADPFAAECDVTMVCSATEVCAAWRCTDTTDICQVDAQCPAGTCVWMETATQCTSNGDCTNGDTCEAKVCTTAADCGDPVNETCDAAGCFDDLDCHTYTDFCKSKFNMPGEWLATSFFLPPGIGCLHDFTDPTNFRGRCVDTSGANVGTPCLVDGDCDTGAGETCAMPVNSALSSYILNNNDLDAGADRYGDSYAYGANNAAGLSPDRYNFGHVYSDGSINGDYCNETNTGTFGGGVQLAARYVIQGDMDGANGRDLGDADELVAAYYSPRAWSLANGATAEVIADFNADGSLTKEDLRYWADGLVLVAGELNRPAAAAAIDAAILAAGQPLPWADPAEQLLVPPASVGSNPNCGAEPTFTPPVDINTFHQTGKPYANGDFVCDVAGGNPVAGANPIGWDGKVDWADIDYCCSQIGDWLNIDEALYMDLSCDVDGVLGVTSNDIETMVTGCLGTFMGDADLNGVADDATTITDNYTHACNTTAECGWAEGDFNCDGLVTSADLDIYNASVATVEAQYSCANHGPAGDICVELGTGDKAAGDNLEPRICGGAQLKVDFSGAVATIGATVACDVATYAGNATVTVAGDGLSATIDLDTVLPNEDCCTVSLTGDVTGEFTVRPLKGDVDLNGQTLGSDMLAVKPNIGSTLAAATARFDVDCSGQILGSDMLAVKPYIGNAAPACP